MFLEKHIREGFTLIELIVVISIIFILMTVTVIGASYFRENAKKKATLALFERIRVALDRYYHVFLDYPPSEGKWTGSQNLYWYLAHELDYPISFDAATGSSITKKFGPAIGPEGFKKKELDEDRYILDSWKHRLYYKKPGEDHRPYGKNNTRTYDLESFGPNGIPDPDDDKNNDDINNWSIER